MTTLNLNSTLANWVIQYPRTATVFEALGLNYCCEGDETLEQACREQHLDPQQVVVKIEQIIAEHEDDSVTHWEDASLTQLCDHLEQTHHVFVKDELSRLSAMISEVVELHHFKHPEMQELQASFTAMSDGIRPHTLKEEQVLFPFIRDLEQNQSTCPLFVGYVDDVVKTMTRVHKHTGEWLSKIRKLTNNYQPPEDAGMLYRITLDGLQTFERDLHLHVHKETHLLFPRAIEVEQQRVNASRHH